MTQSSALSVPCPQSDLHIPTSVVTCPISDLVIAVFLTCTDAASNQDGISDRGCCGLVVKRAGEGARGGWLNLPFAPEPRADSWEDTPWVCRQEPGRRPVTSLQDFAGGLWCGRVRRRGSVGESSGFRFGSATSKLRALEHISYPLCIS